VQEAEQAAEQPAAAAEEVFRRTQEEAAPVGQEEAEPVRQTSLEEPHSVDETVVEKPDLAAAWEMTGPEPGSPPIPPVPAWDSQWMAAGEEIAPEAEESPVVASLQEEDISAYKPAELAPDEEPPPAGPAEFAEAAAELSAVQETFPEVKPAAVVFGTEPIFEEGAAAPPGFADEKEEAGGLETTHQPFEFSTAGGEERVTTTPLLQEEESVAAESVDPALLDEVVRQVLERLSPQVMETIAREIVRPLAEALLREKLRH
jgi:hypothetical protein